MSDTSTTDLLQEALSAVNAAGTQLTQAQTDLLNHITDANAHPELQQLITELLNSQTIWTEQAIQKLIDDTLNPHVEKPFNLAHPGWTELQAELVNSINVVADKLQALTDRVTRLENAGDDSGPSTSLSAIIAEINAKYDPQINDLTALITQAQASGDAELVASYQRALEATLNARNAEIIQATEDWTSQQPGAPEGDD